MENLSQLFRNHNLRITPHRRSVYLAFRSKNTAISSKEIERIIVDIDRITLYRTLKTFEQKGLIHKIKDGSNNPKFALCHESNCEEGEHNDDHAHFFCSDCGETFCIDDVPFPKISVPQDFQLRETNIVLKGFCAKCKK